MQGIRVDRRIVGAAPEPVFLRIGLDQCDRVVVASRGAQVAQGFAIDGKEPAGRAVFRCHIGDGRAVRQRQAVEPRAVKLHEFANDALGAQHFDNLQDQIGACRALDHGTGQLKPDHFRDQHRDRLAQHSGLGLDPADAPAENGRAIDHGCVAVGAHERVRISHHLAGLVGVGPHGLGQILQIHLVADAGTGGHDAEIIEGRLAPFQEGITFQVALIFAINIHLKGARIAKLVNHHRMVDDKVHRVERIDFFRIAAKRHDPVAHCGQIDHGRDTGEILHQHACGTIGDLSRVLSGLVRPGSKCLDVIDINGLTVLEPQKVFKNDLQRGG